MRCSWYRSVAALIAWGIGVGLAGPTFADPGSILKVERDGKASAETPLIVECKPELAAGSYLLVGETGSILSATVFKDDGKNYLGMILPAMAQGSPKTETYMIPDHPGTPESGTGVELIPVGKRVEIRIDGKLVTEEIPDDGPKPYFFPLNGPSGQAMTRSFPMKNVDGEKRDHPHHRSLWFTHGSVNKVDFWSESPGHGRIVETARPTIIGGKTLGRLRTTDDWLAADGRKICEDVRVFTIFAAQKSRILDLDVTLKATNGPVSFGDTKEGMFGLRVATSMDVTSRKGGKIITSEGLTDTKAWGQPASWVDYTGPVDGKTVGIAILNQPSSFRYPTTWHVRDYGLFAANPFGYKDFGQKTSGEYVLPAGESITFRYRVILHDGDTASADLPAAFRAYESSPRVTIE